MTASISNLPCVRTPEYAAHLSLKFRELVAHSLFKEFIRNNTESFQQIVLGPVRRNIFFQTRENCLSPEQLHDELKSMVTRFVSEVKPPFSDEVKRGIIRIAEEAARVAKETLNNRSICDFCG